MTPLTQKLQIKPNKKWLIYNSPAGYPASLLPLPPGATCTSTPRGKFDGIQLFVKNRATLVEALEVIVPLLNPDTIFWVSYPKKSSGIDTDLKMGAWGELYALGLEGVASISVDADWAGSRFRPKGQAKISGTGKKELRKSAHAAFIDVDRKIINLPPDLDQLLRKRPTALEFYLQLSYSNKKEYLLWVLTAKRESTRIERMAKMIGKLAAGRRNPAEK